MKTIQKSCMSRQESWWSYEVCFRPPSASAAVSFITDNPQDEITPPAPQFNSGARQFRATTVLLQEAKKMSYSQVFSLLPSLPSLVLALPFLVACHLFPPLASSPSVVN
jgi:hypothetical protein